MQSRTSFSEKIFSKAFFWKTVTRFWPIWGFYLAVWLLAMPGTLLSGQYNLSNLSGTVLELGRILGATGAFSVSIVSAMAVWSFLYNARAANGTACLPIRREGLYTSAMLAGLLPLLAANLLIFGLTALVELRLGKLDMGALWQWLGCVTLQLLFFYGFATFCAQLTGNIVVLPILYLVLNFTAYVVTAVANHLRASFVYGLCYGDVGLARYASPLVPLLENDKVRIVRDANGVVTALDSHLVGWDLLGIYGAIGAALLIVSLLLLRRRRMESAGDVVAVRALKPVFRWCMSLGTALMLGEVIYLMFFASSVVMDGSQRTVAALTVTVAMLLGAFIGWFAAEMMMKKSFRVFHGGWSGWSGFAVSALAVVLAVLAVRFDLFGTERYVPAPDGVVQLQLCCASWSDMMDDPEEIAAVLDVHRSIIANKAVHQDSRPGAEETRYCSLSYRLKNGREVRREYWLRYDPTRCGDLEELQALLNTPAAIARRKDVPADAVIVGGAVTATLPVSVCARLAGYDDPARYVLLERGGLTPETLAAMSAAEQTAQLNKLMTPAGAAVGYRGSYADATQDYWEKFGVGAAVTDYSADWDLPEQWNYDDVYFSYSWEFTPAELETLYRGCIVPDLADATIGKAWILRDGEYLNSVYAANISLELRLPNQDGVPSTAAVTYDVPNAVPAVDAYEYRTFATTPTTTGTRTLAWLTDHGVEMCTVAQLEQVD